MAANWEAPARTSGDDSQATNRSRPDSAITTPRTKPNGIPGTASGTMSRKPAQKACRSNEKSAIAGTLRGWSRMRRPLGSAMIWPWRRSLAGRSRRSTFEHADNPVHTVEGGLAAGYDGAVVAGTTVFAYLTRPVAAAWGRAWVVGGGYEVWFRGPVLADERVVVAGGPDEVVASVGDRVCARLCPSAELRHRRRRAGNG